MKIRAPKKKVLYKNIAITIYSVGWFALLVNRTPSQIRRWQRDGIIPPPLLDIDGDRRYYTADELRAYTEAYKSSNIRTGLSIHETPFKQKSWDFHARYRKLLEKFADGTVSLVLPNEESIERAFRVNMEEKITEEARLIMTK